MKQNERSVTSRRSITATTTSDQAQIASQHLAALEERSRTPIVDAERLELNYPLNKLTPSSDNPRRISLNRAGVTPEQVGELAIRPNESQDQWISRVDTFLETLRLSNPAAFDTWSDLFDLAISIHSDGLLQPIVANQNGMIVAGERRWTASQLAGMQHNRVIIRSMPESAESLFRLIENLQRSDLTVAEQALGIRKYLAELTGQPCGPDNNQIDISLVRKIIGGGQTKAAYLRAICRLPDDDDLLSTILAEGYTSLRAAYEDASQRVRDLRRSTVVSDTSEQSGAEAGPSSVVSLKPTPRPRVTAIKTRLPGTGGGKLFLENLATMPAISTEMSERVQSVMSAWTAAPEKVRRNLMASLMDALFDELDSMDEPEIALDGGQ